MKLLHRCSRWFRPLRLLCLCGMCAASGCGGERPTPAPPLPTTLVVAPPLMRQAVLVPTTPHTTPIPSSAPAPSATPLPLATPAAIAAAAVADPNAPDAGETALLELMNRTRAEHGLPPYAFAADLAAAARAHSCDLAEHALISHLSSAGQTLPQRLQNSQPPWQWPSENIAAGSADPTVILGMWMDEPPDGPHLLNILSADQQAVGVGYCFRADDSSGNHHYWTADFARR